MLTESGLVSYLARRMPEASEISVTKLARIPGGASRETWSFEARWREDGALRERGFIVRRDPTGSLLETDRDVEFRMYQAMAAAGVPVPPMYWIEPDGAGLERPFFVMGRVEGETNGALLVSPSYGGSREEIARQKAQILARIHRADWRALGVEAFAGPAPTPETAARVEVERWESIMRRDALEPQPVLEAALGWLKRNAPVAPAITVVHGDYRTGNFLYDDKKINAILDWEMAHLGDPMEDIGWLCLRSWRHGTELAGGLVERERFYEMYETAGGYPVDRRSVHFWEVLGNLKLAVIFLTGGRSLVEGRTADLILAMTTRMIPGIEREILTLLEAGP
ncbi:MAG TPA: phosphotransferase family protein [Dehalococcoidia bacterium]|nr:phosphotransferase family protein [Dehalococcoidia bacterium]